MWSQRPVTRNITLAIDEDLLDQVRRIAVEERSSVNAIVRSLLVQKVAVSGTQRRRDEARRRMRALSAKASGAMAEGWRFDRESIYAERLSGHEHSGVRGDGGETRS